LATKTVEDVFDLPIHYYLRVDFSAFEKIIDELGGVEICVDRAFEDNNYPTENFGVQTISFAAGCQKMDGATALKYVRSRHGTNSEGSDFARSLRQQKVMVAVKNKFFSLSTLVSPQKIYNLYQILKDNIQTNIELAQIPHFINLLEKINQENIKNLVLDNSPTGLLMADILDDGAYVLRPRTGNLDEIRNLAKNIFMIKNGHKWEPLNVVVLNGTEKEGWARDTAVFFNSLGFNILKTGNTPELNKQKVYYEKTVIYDLKNSAQEDVLKVLVKSLNANVTKVVPEYLQKEIKDFTTADFLIVLGCGKDEVECQKEEIKK
jgi:LCP family protein required for cell wall assembly